MLLSIQGGSNLGIFEINDAARLVQEAVHPEANIIFGAVIDDTLGDEVRVTVIAAGFDGGEPTVRPTHERRSNFVEAAVPVAVGADAAGRRGGRDSTGGWRRGARRSRARGADRPRLRRRRRPGRPRLPEVSRHDADGLLAERLAERLAAVDGADRGCGARRRPRSPPS